MESGHIAFLDYGEIPQIWHTRVLLAPTTADNFVILTPDFDIYEEQMSLLNSDLLDFHYGGADGALAARIAPASVYGFAPMSPADLARYTLQGRVQANAIRAAAGLPPLVRLGAGPVAPVAQVAPPAGLAAPAPPPGLLGGAAAAAPALVANTTWVALESKGAITRGDVLAVDPNPLPPGSSVSGTRALYPVDGDVIYAKKVPADEVASYKLEDLRVFPVKFDAQGVRRREFNSAVSLLDDAIPQGGGLQLLGPPTGLKFLKMLRDQNQTPTTFHEYWLRSSEIPKGDRSVYEHECLCRVLESMLTIDQLNTPALQSAELLIRRMMVIREAHKVSPASPDYGSADIRMGWQYRRSAQGVVSEMASYVATEPKNEASILKEARKAREEANLRRSNPRGKNKDGAKGGGDQQ